MDSQTISEKINREDGPDLNDEIIRKVPAIDDRKIPFFRSEGKN